MQEKQIKPEDEQESKENLVPKINPKDIISLEGWFQ